jgi:hypothetical protein
VRLFVCEIALQVATAGCQQTNATLPSSAQRAPWNTVYGLQVGDSGGSAA